MVTLKVKSVTFFPSRGDIVIVTPNEVAESELHSVGWGPADDWVLPPRGQHTITMFGAVDFHNYRITMPIKHKSVLLTTDVRQESDPKNLVGHTYIQLAGNFVCELSTINAAMKLFKVDCK